MSTDNLSQSNNREVSFEENDDVGNYSQVSSGEHDDDGDEESPTSAAFIAMLKKWLPLRSISNPGYEERVRSLVPGGTNVWWGVRTSTPSD